MPQCGYNILSYDFTEINGLFVFLEDQYERGEWG
jgi:hypothetical protein